ncbi:MAG: phosphotransferase [Chloroflexi bacterium]|nr:phosphotransferase [Chloroflexota bacterium]
MATLRPLLPEVELGSARIHYLRYKPRTSCLVGYRLEVAGTAVDLYAKAYRPDAHDKLNKTKLRAGVPGPLGPGRLVLGDHALVLVVSPNDDELKALARLADVDTRRKLLRRLAHDRLELGTEEIRPLVYKPERRYVAKVMVADRPRAVLRVYAEPGYRAARPSAFAFRSTSCLRVAQPLGHHADTRTLLLEWLPGRSLADSIAEPHSNVGSLTGVGAALAELHAQNPAGLRPLTPGLQEILATIAPTIGFVCPRVADRAEDLARRLASSLDDQPASGQPVHGDFYASQVLLCDGAVGILDLDEAACGDSAADIGQFIAHLERDALRGTLDGARVGPLAEALLDGYRLQAPHLSPARVELYTAVGLFRLGPHPFRHREPDWPNHTEAILDRVAALLDSYARNRSGHHLGVSHPVAPERDRRVIDRFDAVADSELPLLRRALDPAVVSLHVERLFASRAIEGESRARAVPPCDSRSGLVEVREIRVVRHKPGRRCLVEYDLNVRGPTGRWEPLRLLGKMRSKGPDVGGYRLQEQLWCAGFGADGADGISVPEPVAVVPELGLWLQHKVSGIPATRALVEPAGAELAGRLAEAIHKLHRAGIPPGRRHTIADELRILQDRLAIVARLRPEWADRLERLLRACDRLGAALPESRLRGIHRDFYSDQVVVDGRRLYLVDFDLYCAGDPALDVGNFLGHLTEQALRIYGRPDALADREAALAARFLELDREATPHAVRAYTTLTLARHIYLSTLFPERRHLTETLLDLCEQRLAVHSAA